MIESKVITSIRKRDGRVAPFTAEKITDAIYKAFSASGSSKTREDAKVLTAKVIDHLLISETGAAPDVEEIQDVVERVLIENGYVRTAKSYILYRAERSRVRETNTRLMKIYQDITYSSAVDSDIKRENANVNGDTPMGTMLKYGQEGAKQFNDIFVLRPEHAQAHREGDIHIHDMDFLTLTTTCCQIDLLKLFSGGFSTGHGMLREPTSITSYSALACIAIQSNQNDQHGGQSIVNFDYGLAPGVKKTFVRQYQANLAKALELLAGVADPDAQAKSLIEALCDQGLDPSLDDNTAFHEKETVLLRELGLNDALIARAQAFMQDETIKETDALTHKAMVAFVHNLNTMQSRAGSQTPFSSINYGMDTSPEGRMVVKNILLATEEGLGKHETPLFPIQIFRVKEGVNFNPGDPNYDLFKLSFRVSAKRLFPNYSFMDAPFNAKYYVPGRPETEIAYMGCRTRVIGNVYAPDREISNGRGNLSFTSINLPRLAIKASGNVQTFFESLDQKIELCVDQMLERFEIQARKTPRNFPFLMGQGVWLDSETLGPDDELREVLKHGTLSVGFIGLAETLKSLTGAHHGESELSQNLGLEIIGHMRARTDELSEKYAMNITLLATPAEGLSGRFVRIDKKRFGEIPGVTDRDYYTNSFHVPVYHKIGAAQKIGLEAPYHQLTNAGHITYVELDGDTTGNLEAFEKIVRFMKESGVGYGSINHPVDRDPVCGFTGVIGDQCPGCGRAEGGVPFERIRRITGYLVGTLDRFNNGKRAEEKDRVKHGALSALDGRGLASPPSAPPR